MDETPDQVSVDFHAIRRLDWTATITPGLLDANPNRYPDLFGPLDPSRRRFVLVDETVDRLYGEQIRALLDRFGIVYRILVLPGGESAKKQSVVSRIWAAMEEWGVARFGEPVIIFGGGSLHDVGGFAAATYRRGVAYIVVSTTLVCAIDAMYALKVGVSELYKNRIGTYHPPLSAWADPQFYASLPRDQILEGMGEVFKVATCMSGDLFELLETDGRRAVDEGFQGEDAATTAIQHEALAAMGPEISDNAYEGNPQRASYAGHDISTGMEPAIPHGRAVGLNILWSTMLSHRRGLITTAHRSRIVDLARDLDLPLWHPELDNTDRLAKALAETAKHRFGKQRIPVPGRAFGTADFLNDVTTTDLIQGLNDMREFAAA